MIRYCFLILAIVFQTLLHAQPGVTARKINVASIPSSLSYKGKLFEAWEWKDNLGKNLLILSTTGILSGKNPDERGQQLFACHYVAADTGYRLRWKLQDGVEDCPVDVTAMFIKSATSITDLDKDGIAETTVMYKLACRGDVSPSTMKLIMHEDSIKFALRGTMYLDMPAGDPALADSTSPLTENNLDLETLPGYQGKEEQFETTWGRYHTEKGFVQAPPVFIAFARRHWLRYVKESFD